VHGGGCAVAGEAGTVVGVNSSFDDLHAQVDSLDDEALRALAALVADAQRCRALDAADVDALTEYGFEQGFSSDGLPRDPFVMSGMLVCCGTRIDRSSTGHDCGFVTVTTTGERSCWVWESDEVCTDVIRRLPGPKPVMRSVSLLAAYEGLECDLVVSRARSGVHQMRTARSFVVRDGALVLVTARTPRVTDHRR
jgi:Xaa-Pro aminopeptidase